MSGVEPSKVHETTPSVKIEPVSRASARKLKKETEQSIKIMDALIHKATPLEGKPITKGQLSTLKFAERQIKTEKKTVAAYLNALPKDSPDKKILALIHETIGLLDERAQKIRKCLVPVEEAHRAEEDIKLAQECLTRMRSGMSSVMAASEKTLTECLERLGASSMKNAPAVLELHAARKALIEREAHDKKSQIYLNLATQCIQCMRGEPSKIVDPETTLSHCFRKFEELGMKADDPAVQKLRDDEAVAVRSFAQMKNAMRKFGEIHSNTNKKLLELEAMKHLGLSDEANGLIDSAISELTLLRGELAHIFQDEPIRDIHDLSEMNISELEIHQQRLTQKLATPNLTFQEKNLLCGKLRAAGNVYQIKYADSTNPQRLMNCYAVLRADGPYGRLADTLSSLIDVLARSKPKENTDALRNYNEALGLGAAKSVQSAISDSIRGNVNFISNTMAAILKEVLKNTPEQVPQKAGLEVCLSRVQASLAKLESQGPKTASSSSSEEDTYQYL